MISEATQSILLFVNNKITTQDINDEISECLALYNRFIAEKDGVDLPSVDDSVIDTIEQILNEIIEGENGIWKSIKE